MPITIPVERLAVENHWHWNYSCSGAYNTPRYRAFPALNLSKLLVIPSAVNSTRSMIGLIPCLAANANMSEYEILFGIANTTRMPFARQLMYGTISLASKAVTAMGKMVAPPARIGTKRSQSGFPDAVTKRWLSFFGSSTQSVPS